MTTEEAIQERLQLCPKTISQEHLWKQVVLGKEFIGYVYAMGGVLPNEEHVIRTKCMACDMVDDTKKTG